MSADHDARALRVLLVDDDTNVVNVFRAGLELHGFTVFSAETSEEAMDLASEIEAPIDVLVVDINLPDGFGSTLALRLRQVHPEMKIVYMSGYARHDPILAQGIEEHMVFLDKPFSIARLAETVKQVAAG